MMKLKTCRECGLPLLACISLAMYRKAVECYRLGKVEDAGRFAESANEYYDRYHREER